MSNSLIVSSATNADSALSFALINGFCRILRLAHTAPSYMQGLANRDMFALRGRRDDRDALQLREPKAVGVTSCWFHLSSLIQSLPELSGQALKQPWTREKDDVFKATTAEDVAVVGEENWSSDSHTYQQSTSNLVFCSLTCVLFWGISAIWQSKQLRFRGVRPRHPERRNDTPIQRLHNNLPIVDYII